jgi:hypothetical protein
VDLKELEVSEKKKFGSVSETLDHFFKKSNKTITRRQFQQMLIKHYVDKPDNMIQEIDEIYNSGLRQFLVSDNLHEKKHTFNSLPGLNKYSPELKAMRPSDVGRIGRLINDLRNFVFTYKEFEITKEIAKDCLGERRYNEYYFRVNEKNIDKVFYDSLHSRSDHFDNVDTDL